MPLPIKYDLKCVLVDFETNEKIDEFKARRIRERRQDASFEGGNIASGGHTFSIATNKILNFKPFEQQVICEDLKYLLVAYQPLTHTHPGRSYCAKRQQKEIILELQ